ncbi:MAG: AbrB/MazE/SpoVT family DNA-binding domain-containing protein [Candidatus Aenigmarchaeota archaeon]|nr:AbrB/MazE/SpoVT family DNA-binding domain-containing protein [Candidatus Aenigmarchaeota archaeon]
MEIKEESKIGSKGQVVIPRTFRKYLDMQPGTNVIMKLEEKGVVITRPSVDVVSDMERIAASGRSVRPNPHSYVEELEKRWKKTRR